MLFGPSDLGGSEGRVIFGGGRDHAALVIHDESARASGADVDAEKINGEAPAVGNGSVYVNNA